MVPSPEFRGDAHDLSGRSGRQPDFIDSRADALVVGRCGSDLVDDPEGVFWFVGARENAAFFRAKPAPLV